MSDPFNPEMMTIARDAKGMSLASLAKATRTSPMTIARVESGLLSVPAELLPKIAAALDRPVSYFFLEGRAYSTSLSLGFSRGRLA